MVRRDLEYLGRSYGAHWVREQVDDYLKAVAKDPKLFPPPEERIFPGHYAPVIAYDDKLEGRKISLMRYGAYATESVENATRGRKYTTFNARRDNLTSRFWSQAFMRHHGLVVVSGFFEWVAVRDLLQAGRVPLQQIAAEFDRLRAERKAKVLAQGKKYKPTATELKKPEERQVVIQFQPSDGQDLVVPVIFSFGKLPDGQWSAGFAIITDDPPEEIQAAGHDRCPVVLEPAASEDWLRFQGKSADHLDDFLRQNRRVTFLHTLDEAA
jgi:putative SOS response-associated peptidase YedK